MGANFILMTRNDTTVANLRKEFLSMQESDRNGYSYSGSWGMCEGLRVDERGVFACIEDSIPWLIDQAEKWGPAIAVRAKDKDGKRVWVIGATCAS